MIEPEWTALGNRVGYSTLYRCLNTSTGIYRDNVTSCGGGNTSYQIGWVLSEPNIHTVPLVRYINGSDYLTLADRTSIPTGYVQDVVLGYVLRAVGHIEDRVYLDNGIINVTVDKKFGWNALQAGSSYNEPSTLVNITATTSKITVITNMTQWNTDNGNTNDSHMQLTSTYRIDDMLPLLYVNFTYINFGTSKGYPAQCVFCGTYWEGWVGHETPAIYLNKDFSYFYYRNDSGLYAMHNESEHIFTTELNGVYIMALNSTNSASNLGVGVYNANRPRYRWANWTTLGSGNSTYEIATNYIAPDPNFEIAAYGEPNHTGASLGLIYIGNGTAIDSYFTSLEYEVNFDPITSINQTLENANYIYVRVNSTDIAQIKNGTLKWINSTGTYNLNMTVSELKDHVSLNMTGLTPYNYTYQVFTNATTDAQANTAQVWTNIIDTIPPARITNLSNNTITTTAITWEWDDPADADIDRVMIYLNGNFITNISGGVQLYLNSSLQPDTAYTIGTHTVDIFGNVNQTWVNQTTVTDNDHIYPPAPINLTNTTGNFWINYTWQAGSGNITNSYNVSQNGTWTNSSSNLYFNASVGAHNWSNISVYAFNNSGNGTLNQTPVSQNTQVPNNAITISNIQDTYTINEGD